MAHAQTQTTKKDRSILALITPHPRGSLQQLIGVPTRTESSKEATQVVEHPCPRHKVGTKKENYLNHNFLCQIKAAYRTFPAQRNTKESNQDVHSLWICEWRFIRSGVSKCYIYGTSVTPKPKSLDRPLYTKAQ